MRLCGWVLVGLLDFSSLAQAEERWVAVGYGGRRMVSTDGQKWEITAEWAQPGADDGNNLMSAVFADGKFVAVGGGGGGPSAAGHILVSKDGRERKEVLSTKSRVNPIVYGDGRFVVGVSGFPSGKLMWSKDAETWTDGDKISEKGYTHFRGGAFGNGVFVLVGNGGAGGKTSWAIATPDGEKITSERNDLPGHGTIVFGAGRFLMLTSHTAADIVSSTDGATWTTVKFNDDAKFQWLAWSGKEFLAGNSKSIYRSSDAEKWSHEAATVRGIVKWTDGTRLITSSWPGKMSFSDDAKTWRDAPALPTNGINVVVGADVR